MENRWVPHPLLSGGSGLRDFEVRTKTGGKWLKMTRKDFLELFQELIGEPGLKSLLNDDILSRGLMVSCIRI
jgi:hypothetical protein